MNLSRGGFARYSAAKPAADQTPNGIPDEWEIARGLDPGKASATGRDLDPHYDKIEVYLNSL